MSEETQRVIEQLKATHPQAIILLGSTARGSMHFKEAESMGRGDRAFYRSEN